MRNIISYSPTRHGYSIAVIDKKRQIDIISANIDSSVENTPRKITEHILIQNKLSLSDFNFSLYSRQCECGQQIEAKYSCDGDFYYRCLSCGNLQTECVSARSNDNDYDEAYEDDFDFSDPADLDEKLDNIYGQYVFDDLPF